jgi:hypothetical protein
MNSESWQESDLCRGGADNLPRLFKLHDQIVIREPIDISETFGKEPRQTVAFEAALAALVATVVLSISISALILELISTLAAVVLLLVTIVRKMVLDNEFVDQDRMMEQTTVWIQYLMLFSLIYVAISITEFFEIAVSSTVLLVAGAIMNGSILLIMLFYEFIFGDLLFWSAATLYNSSVKNDPNRFNHGFLKIARTQLNISPQSFNNEHPAVRKIRYQGINRRVPGSRQVAISVMAGATIGILIIGAIIVASVLPYLVGSNIGKLVIVFLLFGISGLFIQAWLQFILSRYGNAEFEDVSGIRHDLAPVIVAVVVIVMYEIAQTGLF